MNSAIPQDGGAAKGLSGAAAVHKMVVGRNGRRASIAYRGTRLWLLASGQTHVAANQVPRCSRIEKVTVSATAITSCCDMRQCERARVGQYSLQFD